MVAPLAACLHVHVYGVRKSIITSGGGEWLARNSNITAPRLRTLARENMVVVTIHLSGRVPATTVAGKSVICGHGPGSASLADS